MEQGERTILSAMDNALKLSYQETVVNNYKEEYYEINDALYQFELLVSRMTLSTYQIGTPDGRRLAEG